MASYGDILALPILVERIAELVGIHGSRLYVAKLLSVNHVIYSQHQDLVRGLWAHMRNAAMLRADLRWAKVVGRLLRG